MITHERLVEQVAADTGLAGAEEATSVIRTVLAEVGLRLDMPGRRRLQRALPGGDRDAAFATVPVRQGGSGDLFQDIGENLRSTPERARYLTRSVLAAVADLDPELGGDLRSSLPPDIAALISPTGPDPARDNSLTDAPVPLDDAEVAEALRNRPYWSGDAHRLRRTVSLPADRVRPLLRRLERASADVGHPFSHQPSADGVTLTLHTRSVDAVTALDLQVADAIDATVAEFGSGG